MSAVAFLSLSVLGAITMLTQTFPFFLDKDDEE